MASVVDRQLPLAPPVNRPATTPEATGPAVFTFKEACKRAANYDEDVARALADAAQLQLDVDQARSMKWPRVDVRTYFQLPLGGENLEDIQHFNGGVFFRYDFEKMFFIGDEVAAARAKLTGKQENLWLTLDNLSQSLFLELADRESLRNEVNRRRDMENQTSDAMTRVRLLEKNGLIKPQRVLEYQYQYETSSRLYQDALRRLAEANRALGRRLQVNENQDVVITDLPALLSSMDAVVPVSNPDSQFLRDVWDARHDTKAAEADLFLKEMAVLDEKRRRIPSLNASVGIGSISLTSTFSQAPVVVQLGASMPLLDFGDIKREISKATVERDLARRNIDLLLMKTQHGVLDSSAALSEAITARDTAEQQWKLISQQSDASQKLYSEGLVDPIDLLNLKVRSLEAEIELTRTRMSVSKAAAEYTLALGHTLVAVQPAPDKGKTK
jgi:outer membrane protein TolC